MQPQGRSRYAVAALLVQLSNAEFPVSVACLSWFARSLARQKLKRVSGVPPVIQCSEKGYHMLACSPAAAAACSSCS